MARVTLKEISAELIAMADKLNEIPTETKNNCPEAEFKYYRFGIANARASLFLEVLKPIFDEHPAVESLYP